MVLCADVLQATPAPVAVQYQAPTLAHDKPVPVSAVASHYHQPKPVSAHRPPHVSWPSGAAKVALGGAGTRVKQASGTAMCAGLLPVRIGRAKTSAKRSAA